ncbi:MAG TPA: flippase [Pseudonocardiaceae bacterium]|nr:flippase [Pseudonocardiaceae bacterium]
MTKRATAIARGVVIQVAARVTGLPLSLVSLIIATRYLGLHGYAVLTTAVVFVGLFDTFTDLGVGTVIVRRVAGRENASLARLVGMNLTFSLCYALPLLLVAVIAGFFAYPGQSTAQVAVLIVSSGLLFDTLSSCLDPVFDVHVRYTAVAAAEFCSRVVTLAASLLVVFADAGLLAMCAVQVLPQLIRMITLAVAARRIITLRLVRAKAETVRLLKESVPFALIMLIAIVYWRVDGVLLSLLSSSTQVAAYGIALQLAFNLAVIPQVFSRSAMSTINASYATDPERFRGAVDSGYRFLLLCSVPIGVLGIPLAGRILTLVANQFTEPATGTLQLFFVACALSFITTIVSNALIAAHEQRFLTRLSAINLVLNIGLNLVFIPLFGAVGTGIALVITELSGVVFTQSRMRRAGAEKLPVGYALRLIPGLVAALAAMWLTWRLPFVVPLSAGGLAYLGGAWLGGALPAPMRSTILGALHLRTARSAEHPANVAS